MDATLSSRPRVCAKVSGSCCAFYDKRLLQVTFRTKLKPQSKSSVLFLLQIQADLKGIASITKTKVESFTSTKLMPAFAKGSAGSRPGPAPPRTFSAM